MRLLTFEADGKVRPGVLLETNGIFDLSTAGFASMLDIIEANSGNPQKLQELLTKASADTAYSLGTVKLLAPIPKPRKLICVGLNYRDHATETGSEIPSVPTIFNKFATSVIAPGENIILPKVS
ncbi:MAG: fumarylacetoacetate hydrolase family protein, partial [Acidobacteriaceae bacterium]|nr:fumarylacetoacetate hydrolase family protein [Acidobacteriaceae bacterium]MBV9307575.1 fumarylacetoacetate hydrolase family protein [Acidobacteriaceae bacterium]